MSKGKHVKGGGGMRGRATGGAWGGGGAGSVRREDFQLRRLLWEGTRGAHIKHVLHGLDAGSVPTQRLVECRRLLPSKQGNMWQLERGGMRGRATGGGRGAGGGASSVQ